MTTDKTPHLRQGGNLVELARKIERIRKTDPAHHARIMRKLAQLERRSRKDRAAL